MTPTASPTNKRSTHHVVLSQSGVDVGLTLCNRRGEADARAFRRNPLGTSAIQIQSGRQKYADLTGVWQYVSQNDWSGGRGSKDFDKHMDMYYDSYNIDTRRTGEVILGPKATVVPFSSFVTLSNPPLAPGIYDTVYGEQIVASSQYTAYQFTADNSIIVKDITLNLKWGGGDQNGKVYFGLAPESGGKPGAVSLTRNWINMSAIPTAGYTSFKLSFTGTFALTGGNKYYLVIAYLGVTPGEKVSLMFGITHAAIIPDLEYNDGTGAGWQQIPSSYLWMPYFYMTNGDTKNHKGHIFEYKGALYYITQSDDGTNSKLYLNGDHGLVQTGGSITGLSYKGYSGVTWGANSLVGSIAVIVKGTGSIQPQNWRVITGNSATSGGITAITFSDEWDRVPAANDVIAIVASDKFTEVTTFALAYSGLVTAVLSANGAVYFAFGDSAAMGCMVAYETGGTWTYNFSGYDGKSAETGQFTHLVYSDGKVFGAKGGYPAQIAYASAVDYSGYTGTITPLAFSSNIAVGDVWERITGLEQYGESWQGDLIIIKEASIHRYREGRVEKLDIREMGPTKDWRNGQAHCVAGNYLYFSWHRGVVRYYNQLLDSVGPDQAEVAVPTADRSGYFSALVSYPGCVIGAVDAGIGNVSNVIAYNERGWCELYRATSGERIQNLYVQSIPGNAVDRLWITQGNSIVWLPMATDPYNSPAATYNGYRFSNEGTLITSWFYVELQEVTKLFYSMRMISEGTSASNPITLAYRIDDAEEWTAVTGSVTNFSQELKLANTPSVKGKRIQFKITLTSGTGASTPRLLAAIMECMPRLPVRHYTDITFRVADKDHDLLKKADSYTTYAGKMTALETMVDSNLPVYVTSVSTALNGKYAWLENVQISPEKIMVETGEEFYIGTARLVDIDN